MPNPIQYKNISDRYLYASDLLVDDVHEAAGFSLYHAFESMGAAWIRKNARLIYLHHFSLQTLFFPMNKYKYLKFCEKVHMRALQYELGYAVNCFREPIESVF